jgi:hypothetical protein
MKNAYVKMSHAELEKQLKQSKLIIIATSIILTLGFIAKMLLLMKSSYAFYFLIIWLPMILMHLLNFKWVSDELASRRSATI